MKIVAAVFADFVDSAPGGPSQLRTPLAGSSILAHTLRRLARVEGVAARCLYVRPRDQAAAEEVLQEAGLVGQIELLADDPGNRARRELTQAARKWCLDAWRGTPLGITWFDEFVDPPTVARVINHYRCHAILCLDGHQPVFDPQIASAMVAHLKEHPNECRFVFTQAPPGLSGLILHRRWLEDFLELGVPFGLMLSYRPELTQRDPITHASCYHVPPEVMQTAGRFTGDTLRSRELLEQALRELGPDARAEALCAWSIQPGHDRAGPLPAEVELELTTDDPLPETQMRPRGSRVPQRTLMDLDAVARLARELAAYDDRLVFLGGHGDPLLHPQFAEVCRILRAEGVYGIAVGTPLLELTADNYEALFSYQVDVIEVYLDAHRAATYEAVHKVDGFGRVLANIQRLQRRRLEENCPRPIVVCSQTRCAATLAELEAFHDHWIQAVGSATIHGYNDYCGVLPPDTLLPTHPSLRAPCRRLGSRLMLLADGSVAQCSQDIGGLASLGRWDRGTLVDTWEGSQLAALRRAHSILELETLPLCRRCTEWFRP